MPFNTKFRKIEIRDVGVRVLDLNVRIQNGAPFWYSRHQSSPDDAIAIAISIIVCGRHGATKFEDWIFDTEDLSYAGKVEILRFIPLGGYHDFDVVNPKASVKIRIRRSYTGFISWDVLERRVVRRGLLWGPALAVA